MKLVRKPIVALTTTLVLALSLSAQASAGELVASGTFTGKSGHATKGRVSVQKSADGYVVELGEDFSLDGAPDPKLAFGKSGGKTPKSFAVLKSNTGAQTYPVPAAIDVGQYDEFYIWCDKYSVPLGHARLK